MRHAPPQDRGFSLIELMITLAVAATVLAIGTPNMQQFIRDSRITTQNNELVGLLNLARSQAIQEGHFAEVCVSSDQQTCSNGEWNAGWLMWVDRNDNRLLDNDEIIRLSEPIGRTAGANAQNSADDSFSRITFQPTGFAELGTGIASASITLQPLSCSGTMGRQITINLSGTIKSRRVNCGG